MLINVGKKIKIKMYVSVVSTKSAGDWGTPRLTDLYRIPCVM